MKTIRRDGQVISLVSSYLRIVIWPQLTLKQVQELSGQLIVTSGDMLFAFVTYEIYSSIQISFYCYYNSFGCFTTDLKEVECSVVKWIIDYCGDDVKDLSRF